MDLETNPFLRYRTRLDSYAAVRDRKMSDEQWVEIVGSLDAAVSGVEGHGFEETPVIEAASLARAAGLDVDLWIKSEPHNVGGSHKARHLMGVAIAMLVEEALGAPKAERLAIASCGNAAMGAGVIAAAMQRPLDVFVPTWADSTVVDRLSELGSTVSYSERRDGEAGDPAYLRFREAVQSGARAFSVQGTETPTTFDGGRTLGWELVDQLTDIDVLYIQVGGGALATSVSMAIPSARLHPVQAEGCAPLRRAWDLLKPEFNFASAAANPDDFMWPWDDPQSFASGILDDVTYDWLPLLTRTHKSGGEPIVAAESLIVSAYDMAHAHTEIPVCSTGSSGLAGLLTQPPSTRERVVLLFTGIDRSEG
ncbi:MAG: threonine synthase [Verrucomicrobiales bacterium]|jgi:threonine synthase